MIVSSHIKASGVLGLGVYAYTGEYLPSIACFLSGWLIDIDHFLDWRANFGPTLDHARVFRNFERGRLRYVYTIFHGWEYVIAVLVLYALYDLPPWATYAALGYTCHLILDQIFNRPKRSLFYFLTYRILHGFNGSFLLMRGQVSTPASAKNQAVHTEGY